MISFDDREMEAWLDRLEAACDALPQIAQQVGAEALGHAVLGARANIYDTPAGNYRRTGDFLRGLDTRVRAGRGGASVTVLNRVDYGLTVETGRETVSLAQLQQLALLRPDPDAPLTLGRSGLNWQVPAPVVTGAQTFAARRLLELFEKRLRGR